jgi:hypothetical protein
VAGVAAGYTKLGGVREKKICRWRRIAGSGTNCYGNT